MKSVKTFFAFICLCLATNNPGYCQEIKLDEALLQKNLKQHIITLASDKMEGRETGTKGEQLAYEYIIKKYKEIGLDPKGTNGYLQPFPFTKGRKLGADNALVIDNKKFKVTDDFFPLPYFFRGEVSGEIVDVGYGISAPKIDYDDYANLKEDIKGKIFLIELTTPEGDNPHNKYGAYADVQTKVETAQKHGALAVIFVNQKQKANDPDSDYSNKSNKEFIPVVFVKAQAAGMLLKAAKNTVSIKVDLEKVEGTGNNVIGMLNNRSQNTVVITAHYDHLGMGGHGSLYRGKPEVHNGADDNASGIGAMLEMAKYLKANATKNNNYMFIAFSGEEMGLLGSNYFVKNPTIPLTEMNYNINMDMLGRLKVDEPVLIINGTGTSPLWNDALKNITILKTKTTESGVGPSDHTSFYLNDIPCLHFFSGTHNDYHKPTDDEPLINYKGETDIIKFILQLVVGVDAKGKLVFTKTKDSENEDRPRFKVTLGVIPDYAFEGEGMRIDGVSDGKPASKAGLLKGDIVLQIGEEHVTDMTSYMRALGKFTKGDITIVKVKRGEGVVEKELTF